MVVYYQEGGWEFWTRVFKKLQPPPFRDKQKVATPLSIVPVGIGGQCFQSFQSSGGYQDDIIKIVMQSGGSGESPLGQILENSF